MQTKINPHSKELLDECRNHYLILFNKVSDAILLLNETNIIDCNPKALELFSCKKDFLIGKPFSQISTITNLEEQTTDFINYNFLSNALKGIPQNFDCDFIKQNGNIINANVKLDLISLDNKPIIQAIIIDISESSQFKRKILNAVIDTQEKERKRFAEDLHDGLGPLLSSIKIYLNLISAKKTDDLEKQDMVQYTNELIDEAIRSAKEISNNLMPSLLNDFGMLVAIKSFCKKINMTGLLTVEIETNDCENRFEQHIEINLYRIILELINNTMKHAQARNIFIKLEKQKQKVYLSFTDDGIGFNINAIKSKEHAGMGINNIFSRVESLHGLCEYHSEPEKGTCVKIEFGI